jgi:hypothetical protein
MEKDCVEYQEIRPLIVSGDCILWKGNGFISRAIRVWSEYSHASLVVKLDRYRNLWNRVFLVEALETGLELRLLSERLKGYDGEAYLFRVGLDEEKAEEVVQVALTACALGVRYDYKSLFRNIVGRVSLDARRYFCSEFVYDIWKKIGIADGDVAPRPGDLVNLIDGELVKICRVGG